MCVYTGTGIKIECIFLKYAYINLFMYTSYIICIHDIHEASHVHVALSLPFTFSMAVSYPTPVRLKKSVIFFP